MHRKSRSFRRRRSTRFSMTHRRMSKFLKFMNQIEGIKEILLSPLTQKFVECDIGNKISPVNPWIYVDKEKIETHLEFYQTESCFYSIHEEIAAFPKNSILVGSFTCASNSSAIFYVCTTLAAEESILRMVERQRMIIQERVQKMQTREPGSPWDTFGSEIEIQSGMNFNLRNLYVVDVHAITLIKQRNKFELRFAEDLLNGYIEMLPGRNTYKIIKKKRLDTGVQAACSFVHKSAQTSYGGYYTKSIQYSYEYEEIEITDALANNLRNFLRGNYLEISSKLRENVELNMEVNDYQRSAYFSGIKLLHEPIEIKIFQDISHCTGKKISGMSWNCLTSGIVAAAYVTNPLFQLSRGSPIASLSEDASAGKYFALIWEYKNNVKPLLYLHSRAEISSISFCPYNKYILVTGLTTGQVVIWDLTESFKMMGPKKYRTMREQQNHLEIVALTSWIKKPIGHKHIFPTITSTVENSHTSPVTSITWVPPESFGDKKTEPETLEYILKFVTCELDGHLIYIWEIDPNREEIDEDLYRFKSRVKIKPEALTRGLSKLRSLQANFTPLSKLFVSAVVHPKNSPILKVLPFNKLYSYKALNPETLKDLNAETNFLVTGLMHPFCSTEKLLIATAFGSLQLASCVGPKTSSGESVEICKLETLGNPHDGPILICETNAFFPNIILTVGGSVFAFWDLKLQTMLLWRKACLRYLSGMWCFHRPLSIVLLRNDRYFEYWNVCESSKTPLKLFKYKGYEPISFYGNTDRFHIRKNTYISTDNVGAFKVMLLTSETIEQKDYNVFEAITFLERIVDVMSYMNFLKKCTNKIKQVEGEAEEEPLETNAVNAGAPTLQETKIVPPSGKEVFEKKLEKHGLSVLLSQKGLDIDNLQPITMPRTGTFQPAEEIAKQLDEIRAVKVECVEVTKKHIFSSIQKPYPKRGILKSTIPKELAVGMKTKFLEDYKIVEKDIKLRMKSVYYPLHLEYSAPRVSLYKKKLSVHKERSKTIEKSLADTPRESQRCVEFAKSLTVLQSLNTIFINKNQNFSVSNTAGTKSRSRKRL